MGETLFQKTWDLHAVRRLPTGQTQLFVGLHLVHEVTSPQAFEMIRRRGWTVPFPSRTVATVDHIVPTRDVARPFRDPQAEEMLTELEKNCRAFGIPLHGLGSDRQGIVHVIGPELGRSEEHTSEPQSRRDLVCRLLLEKKKKKEKTTYPPKKKTNKKDTQITNNST